MIAGIFIGIAVVSVCANIAQAIFYAWRQRVTDRQVIDLCNRVQAGTLQDYVLHTEPAPPPPTADEPAAEAESKMPVVGEGLPFGEYTALDNSVESSLAQLGVG